MEFFAFVVLAAVAMLLVAVAMARVRTDRKKRELDQLEKYRPDSKRDD